MSEQANQMVPESSTPVPVRKRFMAMPPSRPLRKRFKSLCADEVGEDVHEIDAVGMRTVCSNQTQSVLKREHASQSTMTSSVGTEMSYATARCAEVGGENRVARG